MALDFKEPEPLGFVLKLLLNVPSAAFVFSSFFLEKLYFSMKYNVKGFE